MLINRLKITDFRNFPSAEIAFHDGVNVLFGDNGSGKTNILEALFVICLGRSQRGASDQVLVRDTTDVFRLVGQINYNSHRKEISVAYQRGGRKKIEQDGAPLRIIELFEKHCVVSAGPEDSELLSGPPSTRREFLDLYLSQYSFTYLEDLKQYHRALAQKNAALKNEMDASPFDTILASYGSRIMKTRQDFLQLLSELAVGHYRTISNGENFHLLYQPSIPFPESATVSEVEEIIHRTLESVRKREMAAGNSLVGAHRDDLGFFVMNRPAKTHGSQGQWRTIAVSLKLAMYEILRKRRKLAPVLLLDEIFAELDTKRSHELINLFGDFGQLFLTTALEPPEPLRADAKRFRISKGTVEECV